MSDSAPSILSDQASETTPARETTITLYRGWLDPGKYVWSPFVIKLETRFRFDGLQYRTACGSPRESPNGKIPYIEYRGPRMPHDAIPVRNEENGLRVWRLGDSTQITTELILSRDCGSATKNPVLWSLSAPEKALDLSLRALLENKLCFYHTRERWIDNYYAMRDHVLWNLSYPMRVVVGWFIYRKQVTLLHDQGTGRFESRDITRFKEEIWETISNALAEVVNIRKQHARASGRDDGSGSDREPFWFLGGKEPTEVDATLYGFIVSVLICTAAPESQSIVRKFPVLIDYASRIHDKYFSEYEKWDMPQDSE
ncbi:hypothetical protein QBC46DRAFT_395557 [Diplogelasinospora grovesii]|uniref:Thioredoxin-like fold domain-containing protein n=1 Tax=Diplogelasinospora grovesii TaxID=303347 RepID=A0AAN6N128_9PEZI|nr:hypothetical protein QBC46DRAFT_395557 [Diplogelasinospora grovesii]